MVRASGWARLALGQRAGTRSSGSKRKKYECATVSLTFTRGDSAFTRAAAETNDTAATSGYSAGQVQAGLESIASCPWIVERVRSMVEGRSQENRTWRQVFLAPVTQASTVGKSILKWFLQMHLPAERFFFLGDVWGFLVKEVVKTYLIAPNSPVHTPPQIFFLFLHS